jgi:hypothetical protein
MAVMDMGEMFIRDLDLVIELSVRRLGLLGSCCRVVLYIIECTCIWALGRTFGGGLLRGNRRVCLNLAYC